ncbi:MAG: hypothetical protein IKM38_09815 [Christensenellaceae bacterium]|nr:hypothetical protein [Christensenellaceae bacterium]
MKKKKYFWFFCGFLLLASSALGFSMGKRSDPIGEEEVAVIAEEKITCLETKLRLKKSFSLCGHEEITERNLFSDEIGLSEKDFLALHKGWAKQRFSAEEIVLTQKTEGYCEEHIIACLDGKSILLYQMQDGEKIPLERMELTGVNLPPDILAELSQHKVFANREEAGAYLAKHVVFGR